MNKIVITGASGFLGSHLVKKLENKENIIIYALSSKEIKSDASNLKTVHKDIIYKDEAKQIFEDAIVINCAFPRNSTGTAMADGLAYNNNLFMICKKHRVKAIINISSQSVYSQSRESSADENTEICLESPYAIGKYATELMLKSICDGTNIKYTNLRMPSLIGPGFDQRIVNRLIKKALNKEKLVVYFSSQTFGFLDVEDSVNAIVLLLESDIILWENIYNVGNEKAYSLVDIANTIEKVFEKRNIDTPKIEYIKSDSSGTTAVSFEKIKKFTGYNPIINLEESIEKILEHELMHN